MQHAIRLAVCMALASTSTAAWGEAQDGASATTDDSAAVEIQPSDANEITPVEAEAADEPGGGGREVGVYTIPERSSETPAPNPMAAGPRAAPPDAAVQAWSEEQFLKDVWAPNP